MIFFLTFSFVSFNINGILLNLYAAQKYSKIFKKIVELASGSIWKPLFGDGRLTNVVNWIFSPVTSEGGGGKKLGGSPAETILSQFEPPVAGGWKRILWRVSLPLIYLFYYTVPDCRMEKWRSWYAVTFTLAMLWIAIFSYFMVWTITIIGKTWKYLDSHFLSWGISH